MLGEAGTRNIASFITRAFAAVSSFECETGSLKLGCFIFLVEDRGEVLQDAKNSFNSCFHSKL